MFDGTEMFVFLTADHPEPTELILIFLLSGAWYNHFSQCFIRLLPVTIALSDDGATEQLKKKV